MAVRTTATLLVVAASARAGAEPRIEVGGYVGPTSTTIYQTFSCPSPGDPTLPCVTASEPHYRGHGVSLGAYIRYSPLRFLHLEGNVMYAQKGYGGQDSARIHYLEVPLLARLDPLAFISPVRPFAYAGLAPAVQLFCHESGLRFENSTQEAVPYSDACGSWVFLPNAPKRFDLGAVVGGGIGWESPWGLIEVQVRYVEGLIDNAAWDGGKTVNKALYLIAGFGRLMSGN